MVCCGVAGVVGCVVVECVIGGVGMVVAVSIGWGSMMVMFCCGFFFADNVQVARKEDFVSTTTLIQWRCLSTYMNNGSLLL